MGEYFRIVALTLAYRTKNLVTKAFGETKPAVVAHHSYTRGEKYATFWEFFCKEKVGGFTAKLENRKNFPGLNGSGDLDHLWGHIRSKTYQSGFQILLILFYFWLHHLLSGFWVNFIALFLLGLVVLHLMAHRIGWLTTVFHMVFYVLILKQLFFHLNPHQAVTAIYLYNFLFRGFVESALELLMQPLIKFKVIGFIYHRVIKKMQFFLKNLVKGG